MKEGYDQYPAWTCCVRNGVNTSNFCSQCGKPRPEQPVSIERLEEIVRTAKLVRPQDLSWNISPRDALLMATEILSARQNSSTRQLMAIIHYLMKLSKHKVCCLGLDEIDATPTEKMKITLDKYPDETGVLTIRIGDTEPAKEPT